MENEIRALSEQIRQYQVALGQDVGYQPAQDGSFTVSSPNPAQTCDQFLRNLGSDLHQFSSFPPTPPTTRIVDERNYSRHNLFSALQKREELSHGPLSPFSSNLASGMTPELENSDKLIQSGNPDLQHFKLLINPPSFGSSVTSSQGGTFQYHEGWSNYKRTNSMAEGESEQTAREFLNNVPLPVRQNTVPQTYSQQNASTLSRERAHSIAGPTSSDHLLSTATPEALALASFEHVSSGNSLASLFSGLNLNQPSALVPVSSQGGLRQQRSTPDLNRQLIGPSPNNRKTDLYKTELCRSWEEKGSCAYEERCQFAHGHEELRPVERHPRYKTELCRTYIKTGSCPYAKRCCFRHEEGPLERFQQSLESSSGSKPRPLLARVGVVSDSKTGNENSVMTKQKASPATMGTSSAFDAYHQRQDMINAHVNAMQGASSNSSGRDWRALDPTEGRTRSSSMTQTSSYPPPVMGYNRSGATSDPQKSNRNAALRIQLPNPLRFPGPSIQQGPQSLGSQRSTLSYPYSNSSQSSISPFEPMRSPQESTTPSSTGTDRGHNSPNKMWTNLLAGRSDPSFRKQASVRLGFQSSSPPTAAGSSRNDGNTHWSHSQENDNRRPSETAIGTERQQRRNTSSSNTSSKNSF